MSSDAAVRSWYAHASAPTDIDLKVIDWVTLAIAGAVAGRDVLNIGISFSRDEQRLAPWARRWVALDFAHAVTVRSSQSPHPALVRYVTADMRALPFRTESFDVVLDFSSSDHVRDERGLIWSEVFRVLRPGGMFVCTYANRHYTAAMGFPDADDHSGDYGYTRLETPEAMRANLEGAGFAVVCHEEPGPRSSVVGRKPPWSAHG